MSIALVCVMLVTSMGAYSGDVGNDIAIIITAQEDRAAIHAQQIEDTMLQLESERTPTHLYKHIAAPIQYVTVEGFANKPWSDSAESNNKATATASELVDFVFLIVSNIEAIPGLAVDVGDRKSVV